jgi:hypothetical protein
VHHAIEMGLMEIAFTEEMCLREEQQEQSKQSEKRVKNFPILDPHAPELHPRGM